MPGWVAKRCIVFVEGVASGVERRAVSLFR